jgi:glucosylceramidase
MAKHSRRSFLHTASAAAAALSVSARVPMWAQSASAVRMWSTFGSGRHAEAEAPAWKASPATGEAIVVDVSVAKQEILGFGAALTDSSCYVLSQMKDDERQSVMHDLFAPGEMAFNVCRTCVGASDYARNQYSLDESDTPDPEMKKFSIDHDKAYILPVLREARQINSDLFLFSSPWSPPGWMKPNRSMLGGAMRKTSFPAYALYFQKFLEGYKAEGVLIDAVTVQNETDAEQEGKMPACLWAQEQEMEFAAKHLAPALRTAGLSTKIWVLDHNYSLWGRALDELSDADVYKAIDGIAWHGYVGDPSAMTRVHDAFPDKNAYWTEGGPDISLPDYQTDWTKWADTFNGILNNWARCITAWNIALDEKGKPNIGPFSCGGTVTIENGTIRDAPHKVTRSGQYHAFAHYTRHVKRGAKVLSTGATGKSDSGRGLSHVAFRNPDGGYVAVVANPGPERTVQLEAGRNCLEFKAPADSVHTLEWS